MSDLSFKLIAGLGNPGKDYAQTRHNIGFLIVDALASASRLELNKNRFESAYAKGRIKGREVFLVKPMSYMNRSGVPIQKFAAYYKIELPDIIIVHDDMDLDFGKVKIVQGRGHGGHNGVRSIIDSFGKKECIRVRVGVGHPGGQRGVTGYVLGRFTPDEQSQLDLTIGSAVDACLSILGDGITKAMNAVNARR
ncbi:MAG: aminoacyl-tRNA hydrolase [Desulfobacteraceae bacterium]|nr:aminoacyl-tRNA hydrolase [Desulfobacteraceae bacterium]